jgi:hypothetical protein
MPLTTTELLELFESGSSSLYRDKGMVTTWEGKINISPEHIECLKQFHTTLPNEIKNEFKIIFINAEQIAFIIRSKAYNYLQQEKDNEISNSILTDLLNNIEGSEISSNLLPSPPSTILSNSISYNPISLLDILHKN